MSVPENGNHSWSEPAPNPTAAGASPEIKPAAKPGKDAGVKRIEYLTSIRFLFSHPQWFKNLLLGGLCVLIPVLNQLLLFGYMYEIVERLHRGERGTYPLFDFSRFSTYITRGVWPFLIAFIAQAIMQPAIQFPMQFGIFGLMAAFEADETTGAIAAAIGIPLALFGLLALTVALTLVLTPLMLRAGLAQDFSQAFKFAWIKDFIRRMWLEAILVNLFMILANMILMPIGCLFFCYGGFMVAFGLTIPGAHLAWQLYELYLARGGEPIPLKPLPADMPPIVLPPHKPLG
ncbi:MAG: DUF4013 domain-containing protein [Pirellulaceae bacterium]